MLYSARALSSYPAKLPLPPSAGSQLDLKIAHLIQQQNLFRTSTSSKKGPSCRRDTQ